METLSKILLNHAGRYPLMEPTDAVKLIYQNEFGGGHLIRDVDSCLNYLRQEYESVSNYLTHLMMENASLKHQYANSFDLAEVEAAALALGMIPATEANTIILPVHIPAAEPEPTFWEDLVWFAQGLFA